MGVSPAWAAVAVSATAANTQRIQANQARRAAEAQAALEREALAKLQAEPEPAMPLDDLRRSRRRSISAQMRRRGRASTILTDTASTDALGA